MLLLIAVFLAGTALRGNEWSAIYLNMYLFLRLITFIWETGSGRITPSVPVYVAWAVLPFTLKGPIIRYSQFEPQFTRIVSQKQIAPLPKGWWLRLGLSAVQIILAIGLLQLQTQLQQRASLPAKFVIVLVTVPWGFYLLVAGYLAILENLALLWGIVLPPSFNLPFGRRNIAEFWANWNMTATSVFRDYVFYNRWGRKNFNIYFNTLILFTLVGLWHSVNWYWGLWGVLHGIGFCVYLWHKKHQKKVHLELPQLFANQGRMLGAVATYLYVCAAWALPSQLIKLFR
jgi:membrane protein involved in D-alanine export